MRRSDREIRDFEQIKDVLDRCDTIRLGINGEGWPYVVPLSFGWEEEAGRLALYVHGASEGLKHDLLKKDDRVCVEADICHCFADTGDSTTTMYESVIGFGHARRVFGAQAEHGLDLILKHCGFEGHPYDRALLDRMTIYRIVLDTVTGKQRKV